ncbi:MAG: two-component system sensor histidine kinase QseC [Alphaproteobacteria bacterium]
MSIQSQLIKLIISLITIATFIAAMHGYRNSQQQLNNILDEDLQTLASFILNSNPQGLINLDASALYNSEEALSNNKIFQLFTVDHQLIASSNDAPITPISSIKGFSEEAFAGVRWRTFTLVNANAYVIIAQSDKYRRDVTEQILLATLVPVVLSIPFIGLIVFYIIRKSLSPLRYLSTELTNKHSEDLSGVHISAPSKELVPVVNRLNELFGRLASSFELEKQLSANAAHELRTPISVLAIASNNLVEEFKQGTLTQLHFDQLNQNVERMAQVIEQIIGLFRFTSQNIETKKTQVDLEKVLQEVISNNYISIEDAHQTIALKATSSKVMASEFALYVLFENLIRNAHKYGGEGCHISIDIVTSGNSIDVIVEDSGKGLCDQDMQKLAERFFRAANQNAIKGSGLGLAISKHIINLHQGSLYFGHSDLGGLLVKVSIPKGNANVV